MLIQGAAIHSSLTLHYLVRDEIDATDPRLISIYDRLAVGMPLVMWRGEAVLMAGRPRRFWSRIGDSRHPFHHHPLLAKTRRNVGGSDVAACTETSSGEEGLDDLWACLRAVELAVDPSFATRKIQKIPSGRAGRAGNFKDVGHFAGSTSCFFDD